MWQPGETVVHQEVWGGRIWAARPLRVVDDRLDRTLLWMPHGTMRKVPVTPPTRPDPTDVHRRTIENLRRGDWILGDHRWDVSCLWILRPDTWSSIWVAWRPDGCHLGWYINLQRPMRRNPVGFEAMDLMLDVVVEPDLSWRWKDREEFDEIVERGVFDSEVSATIEAEAQSLIGDVEERRPPFGEPWPSWRADSDWPRPALTEGWNVVFG